MDLKDLSTRKCVNRAVYREEFHFLVLWSFKSIHHEHSSGNFYVHSKHLRSCRSTSTNPVTDLHFDTKNNGCINHLDYDKYENTQMHI